jgi:hypothetical protein
MKGQLNIETMYAFIIRDVDGTEGVVGMMGPMGWVPFVGADMEKVEQLTPQAQSIANQWKKTITVAHFSKREDIKFIEPNRTV